MWRAGSSTMMRRAGLSWRGKDDNVLILSSLAELPSSWRSNILGYVAREFACCCLLHISANVETVFGGRRGGEGSLSCPVSVLVWGREMVGVWWVASLEVGRCLFQLVPAGSLLTPLLL